MHRHKITELTAVGDFLLSHGIRPADYLNSLDLPPASLLDGDLWLDRDKCLLISYSLRRVTCDPLPGMHVAERQDLRNYGLWMARIFGGNDLGGALRAAADNINLIESGRRLELSLEGGRARLHTDFAGKVAVNPREHLDASLVIFSRLVNLAVERVAIEVHLTREPPADTAEIERLLGPNLVFRAEENAVILDRDALALPITDRTAGPVSANYNYMPSTPAQTTAAVVRLLHELVCLERPTAVIVADTLGMSLRTMQRHLAAWGVTFEQLLDDFRLHHALIQLRDKQHSVTDVAFGLGYSDSAHFTRAFRRWTGCTPRQYRAEEGTIRPTITSLLTPAAGHLMAPAT